MQLRTWCFHRVTQSLAHSFIFQKHQRSNTGTPNNDIQVMYSKIFPCCRRRGKDPSSPDSMSNGQSTHHHDRTMSPYSASDQESLLPAHMLRALKHDPTLSPDCMKVRTTFILSLSLTHSHTTKTTIFRRSRKDNNDDNDNDDSDDEFQNEYDEYLTP